MSFSLILFGDNRIDLITLRKECRDDSKQNENQTKDNFYGQ